jgi:hypothetical protein
MIVKFVWFGNSLGYFFKNLADFFQSSDHPDLLQRKFYKLNADLTSYVRMFV